MEQGARSREQGAKSREQEDRPVPPPTDTKPPSSPATRTSQKPISESFAPSSSLPAPSSMLPAPRSLLPAPAMSTWSQGLTPADRAVKLAAVLYSDQNLPSPSGQPVRLIDCLRTIATNNRANVVDAYWAVRQAAAQYETFLQEIVWLEALRTTLAAQNPPSPTAMLKLRAVRLAVEARRTDTEADWTMARHQLAGLAVGREQGATSREQGATSREQGATSREQGATSREQGATSREQGATSREQGAKAMSSPRPYSGEGQGVRDINSPRLLGEGITLPQPVSVPFVGRLPLPASGSVGILPASSPPRSWPRRRLEATIPAPPAGDPRPGRRGGRSRCRAGCGNGRSPRRPGLSRSSARGHRA